MSTSRIPRDRLKRSLYSWESSGSARRRPALDRRKSSGRRSESAPASPFPKPSSENHSRALGERVLRQWHCCLEKLTAYHVLLTALPRFSRRRAPRFATSTKPNNTKPAAHAWRCQSSYGAMAYVYIITGSEAVGCPNPGLQNRLPKAVKSSGAVSPATRASASNIPVSMPPLAAGSTTVTIVFHLLAPRAIAPSRRLPGTALRNSSVLRTVIGITIIPNATPPANAEKCFTGNTTSEYAKIPITMEGTPFSRSVVYRTTKENVLPPNSARYTPVSKPTGKPINAANINSFRLPTMAFAIPPPDSPTGFGSCVKKAQFRDLPPFQIKS